MEAGAVRSARYELTTTHFVSNPMGSVHSSLIESTNKDWRFVLPTAIAENVDGYKVIPRMPSVLLSKDPNWLPLNQIQPCLEAIVKSKAR